MRLHFIVGTGRCGSSLVHEMLARHEEAGFISNVDDNLLRLKLKGRWNNRLYAATRGSWTRKGALRFAPSEAYRLIASEVAPLYANSCRDLTGADVTPWLRKRFHDFFAARYTAQAKPTLLHKYTGWSRIGFFAEIFPAARFLHVVRDGRAVANSWLQMGWWDGYRGPENWLWGSLPPSLSEEWRASGGSFVTLSGIAWKLLMQSYETAASQLDSARYLQVRYEDFLANPQQELRAMADFLQLRWSRRLAKALDEQRLDASRSRAFERDLTGNQLMELQQCLQPVLARYGYGD